MAALGRAAGDVPFEVRIVLNAPADEVVEFVRDRVGGVEVIHSPVNLGTAASYNRAFAASSAQWLVTMHDDAEPQPDWLEALVETARATPDAGELMSRLAECDVHSTIRIRRPWCCRGESLWRSGRSGSPDRARRLWGACQLTELHPTAQACAAGTPELAPAARTRPRSACPATGPPSRKRFDASAVALAEAETGFATARPVASAVLAGDPTG